MILKRTFDLLISTVTGFTIAHSLLCVAIIADFYLLYFSNIRLYDHFSLHYSNNLTWYIGFFIFPLFVGLLFYFLIKKKDVLEKLRRLFTAILLIQIAFTLTATILNYNYWGYTFKRPSVFSELINAKEILTFSNVSNIDSTGFHSWKLSKPINYDSVELRGRKNLYYATQDRGLMVLQDLEQKKCIVKGFEKNYLDPEKKISPVLARTIEVKIRESNFIDYGKKGWDNSGQLKGIIIEFKTDNNSKYLFAGLDGGQVSNDHYSYYEFLFTENRGNYELIKKQKFYTDIAGIEGLEYANVSPFFSLLLTFIGLFIARNVLKTKRKLKIEKHIIS